MEGPPHRKTPAKSVKLAGRIDVQIRRIQSLQRLLREELTSPEQLKLLPFSDLEDLAIRLEAELGEKLGKVP